MLPLEKARVCVSHGERARVMFDDFECDAVVSGALAYSVTSAAELPVTGDWVHARRVDPDLALIESVLPRHSKIARRAAGRRDEEQVLAANIDVAFLVAGLDGDANIRRLERYLAIAREGGVQPVVVLNKADLCGSIGAATGDPAAVAGPAPIVTVSARTGAGCDVLQAMLGPGVTAVLLGSSGAGKSTLLNRIAGGDLQATAPVRESDHRGRHTTTHRELIPLPTGGALIDTPGLREVQLWATSESVAAVFDDIAALAAHCRFSDCTHSTEPGCAVRDAVDAGRLNSFHKLQREVERVQVGPREMERRWRSIHKAARRFRKLRGR